MRVRGRKGGNAALKKKLFCILLVVILASLVNFVLDGRHAPRQDHMGTQEAPFPDLTESSEDTAESDETEPIAEHYVDGAPETDNSPQVQPFLEQSDLQPGEIVVMNYQELKTALEGNNGITNVYFGADITMQLGGVRINPGKGHVTVSGLNPLEPERTEPYTLTDYSSASFYSTIYIDAAGVSALTVRDIKITGKNFYGPFSILDAAALSGVSLLYQRVDYNGPQMVYHRRGTVKIEDCTVRIHGGNGGSANQEFSEAKNLMFSGKNSINTESSGNTVFWHPLGGAFSLDDYSALTVTSPNTSTLYGVFYADSYLYDVGLTVGEKAKLEMTISGVIAPEAYVTLNGITVREGGEFRVNSAKSASAAVLSVDGALTVEKEARFIINGESGGTNPLLKQEGGDISVMEEAVFRVVGINAYPNLITLAGVAFLQKNPASVLLCNANRCITAASNSAISITAQQINYWNAVSPGGLDAPPLYKWEKADGSLFSIDGTVSAGAKGEFTSISSNYEPSDPPGTAPDANTFSMDKARVLAFGRLELTLIQPTVHSTAISGVTRPGAVVRVTFSQGGKDHILPDTAADSTGIFHIPLDVTLEEGTIVTAECSWNYLTATAEAAVEDGGGTLEFIVPDTLEFLITGISAVPQTAGRLHSGWEIIVSDSRGAGGWSIYARLGAEMTPSKTGLPVLKGGLLFIDDTGAGHESVLSTETDTLIVSRITASTEETYPVLWDEDKGILLSVMPGTVFADTVYSGSIIWTLVDAP